MKKSQKIKHVAIIPARSGSKGVKFKNLRKIGNTSLVKRAWNSCLEAGFFQTIILSTDSEAICKEVFPRFDFNKASINKLNYYREQLVFHKRNSLNSSDFSSVYDLVREIISKEELSFDYLWLVQPTNPFRTLSEFHDIRELCEGTSKFTSIVSVKDVNGYHPNRMFKLKGEHLIPYERTNLNISIPRQLLPKIYIKDGGYYVFRETILKQGIYLGNKILPYVRPTIDNVNIDTIEDLKYAQLVNLKNKKMLSLVPSLFQILLNIRFIQK